MAVLVTAIHAFFTAKQVVDGRNKSGNDARVSMKNSIAIDINADMGESFGRWVLGNDAALMPHVASANITRIWGWHKRFRTYWSANDAPSALGL
jgi:hypothetical protein